MEEYRPLAADGAAPDGQTRLPWGDEAPTVTVETPAPVAVEAHPPEPITHFASPEATFFTAEPARETDTNGHRDVEDDAADDASDEGIDDQLALDEVADEQEAPAVSTVDDEPEAPTWHEDTVDDVWSDDEVWAPPSTLDVEEDEMWAPPPAAEVAEEPPPAVPAVEPVAGASLVAGDEIEAALDELLPSAEELAPLEEASPAAAETLPPWTPPPVIEELVDEPVVDEPVAEEPVAEEQVPEPPVVDEPVVAEPAAIDEPVVEEPPAAEAPVAEEPSAIPVAEPPRMVSPSHPEWVEQERVVVDDAAPELEWADPEAADFGFTADAPVTPVGEAEAESAAASSPVAPTVEAEQPQPSEWFNPPEPEPAPDVAADAPAAEWLTVPELDEQLAAVSESPPPLDELPPMVTADEPLAPVASSSAIADFERPIDHAEEPADPTVPLPLPLEPTAPEATIVDLPLPPATPEVDDEPVALPAAAPASTRTLGIRRIAMVAAVLIVGTVVVRQLNPSAIGNAPTFVGVTPGQSSQTQTSRADQPATAGSTGGSHHVAAGKTSTTVAGGKATTGSTVAGGGSTGTTVAGGNTTATTTAGGKTTPTTTAAPAATTPASTPGYTAAKKACTDFNRAYVARDSGGMTDDQADDVFVNTASALAPANSANPSKWGSMYSHAVTLQKQLEGTVDSTDQQIEDQIAAVYRDCKANGLI